MSVLKRIVDAVLAISFLFSVSLVLQLSPNTLIDILSGITFMVRWEDFSCTAQTCHELSTHDDVSSSIPGLQVAAVFCATRCISAAAVLGQMGWGGASLVTFGFFMNWALQRVFPAPKERQPLHFANDLMHRDGSEGVSMSLTRDEL
eukprot:scaffold131301_cov32-Tisochrysis_lutea.AAC.9